MKKSIGLSFALIYISIVCAFSFDGFTEDSTSPGQAWILFSIAVCFTYGVLALHRDLTLFGALWIIKSFDKSIGISEFINDVKSLFHGRRKNNR